MARFFIDRPVFAIVISLVIVLGGVLSALSLPIGQYPEIEPPTVQVSTTYVGANSQVVNDSVGQVIESQVNGVEGMDYMYSYSTDTGSYTLNVVFNLGTDADMAAVKVQNNVSQANANLPAEVISAGVVTEKSSANMAIMIAFYSPEGTYDSVYLYNYVTVYILDAIKRVAGVGNITVFGPEFSRRLWINPDKMAELGITSEEVIAAVREQNVQAPAGTVGGRPAPDGQEFQYTGKISGRLTEIEQFENIIIRAEPNGSFVFLKDIGRVDNGARHTHFETFYNEGKNAVGMGVYLTSDANILDAVTEIKQIVEDSSRNFPPDLKYSTIMDNSENIVASLEEVVKTFFEAMFLVIVIVFIFLQSFRATLIPMLAVPVSLLGTFASFVILGFSINTLTLFAMVLAIGLVVDDAIVVIEAVEYHIKTTRLSPREATIRAMEEVSGPVVAIAFVLGSVFVPVAFMGGMTGILYRQFALTIAVSMALSAFIALSLTPALCVTLLKPHDENARGGFMARVFDTFNLCFDRMTRSYSATVRSLIRHAKYGVIFLLLILVGLLYLTKIVPTTFVPEEDQGYFIAAVTLQEGASLNRTIGTSQEVGREILNLSGVRDVLIVAGYDALSSSAKSNAGTIFVGLENWEERTSAETQINAIIGGVFAGSPAHPEADVIAFNPPPLPGLGMLGGFTMYLQDLEGRTSDELSAIAQRFLAEVNQQPELEGVYTTFQTTYPGYEFRMDREKIKTNGVSLNDVFNALQVNFGGYEINDFNLFGRTYKVVMQADTLYRNEADAARFIFVRSQNGSMVPLNALITPVLTTAPPVISRFNAAQALQINGSAAPGYSSGQALAAMERLAAEKLPSGFAVEWSGQSREERKSSGTTTQILGLAVVFVFLCLAALYESWSVPFAVLLSVPTGIFGTFLAQHLVGLENSIYMQIGVITLIGLAAKNAILIVEYAKARTDKGIDVEEATVEASGLRLRPILMTSFAFIIGCLPLAVATGAGAASRNAMGTAVVGGMIAATALGVFLIPVLYAVVVRTARKVSGR